MSLKFRTDDVIDLVHRKVVEFPRTRGGAPKRAIIRLAAAYLYLISVGGYSFSPAREGQSERGDSMFWVILLSILVTPFRVLAYLVKHTK